MIIEDESEGYIALVPSLPGCHTQGDTIDEVLRNISEAIELYLETLSDEEKEELLQQRVVGIQRVRAFA
ncbi:MAG: type II toxin-antitoxin system HicB family antitoxin [Thermoprotei archaeon]|nr:MAG: type II toxin-antitoxin system HicB family antitoxin [Thermoprotei archaeon]